MKLKFETQKITYKDSFTLSSGREIQSCEVAFQTYGQLNKEKSNGILICHALTGDQFCSGINPLTKKKGWWDILIGPGKIIDTNIFLLYVVMFLVVVWEVLVHQQLIQKPENNMVLIFQL